MTDNTEIYASCPCVHFDFQALQEYFLANERCVAYRDALHIQWHQGDVFIFNYGVIVFWQLTDKQRHDFLFKLNDFTQAPLPKVIDDEFTFEPGTEKPFYKE